MIRFEARKGHWGEYGWQPISFWTWLRLLLDGGYCIRTKWTKSQAEDKTNGEDMGRL